MKVIVCVSPDWGIGDGVGMLYHIPGDLKYFREQTAGHTVIMGRKTLESLPGGKPLPKRRNIVLTRQDRCFPGTETFPSLHEALAHCNDKEEVFIIGGASVYAEALPLAQKLYLTIVDDFPSEADTFFPTIAKNEWKENSRVHYEADEQNDKPFDFVDLVRI